MKKWTKIKCLFVVAVLAAFLWGSGARAEAAVTIYAHKERTEVAKDVFYERSQQITDEGLRDIHVLSVPLNNPYITFGVAESKKEFNLKETVLDILTESKAVAGVNGDFFALAGTYSSSFGPIFVDGTLKSVSGGFNRDANNFAGFFFNTDNNPFIMYMRATIQFKNDGKQNINIHAINKVTDMVMPIIVNREAMTDTKGLDARFTNLVKVVIKDNRITYVSGMGETVDVPDGGYVIVMSEKSGEYYKTVFQPGQTADLQISANLDMSKLVTAVGGAGRILLDGTTVHDTGTVVAGRQPRTALGISRDKTRLILMVVDGRSHSIGATHDEMAELLLSYGAFNAMHLDGGGSSTMVIQDDQDEYRVVNTVPGGYQRKVANAFGIYDNAPIGEIERIVIAPGNKMVFRDAPVEIDVYGLDAYNHRIEIDPDEISVNSDDPFGSWSGRTFTPSRTGIINFIAAYGSVAGESDILVSELKQLDPSTKTIRAMPGDRVAISFTGTNSDGNQAPIPDGVVCEVLPQELGHMEDGYFVADQPGAGLIKCSVGDVTVYLAAYVGGLERAVFSFNNNRDIGFSAYPESSVTGGVGYQDQTYVDNQCAAVLNYGFSVSDVTQAAYLVFRDGLQIPDNPIALKLHVYGDQSGHWLRGRITDAAGKEYTIDFSRNVDWVGWQQVSAVIPSGVKYPIRLDRVYLACLYTAENVSGRIFFDSLLGVYPTNAALTVPEGTKFTDSLWADLRTPGGGFDITLVGDMTVTLPSPDAAVPDDYRAVQQKALSLFTFYVRRGLFVGDIDFPIDVGIPVYQWNTGYIMHQQDNAAILQMSAAKGGFLASGQEQWWKFAKNIESVDPDVVIVTTDISPLQFSEPKEFELFHKILVGFKEKGKTVFVVSKQGTQTTTAVRDGIRYINLGGLYGADQLPNPHFRVLRIRVNGKTVTYELQIP